jgi:hypothetical protein
MLLTGFGAAACGSAGPGVADVNATTTTASSTTQSKSSTSPPNNALAFVDCMRTHGEPNMPEPVISGHNVQISVTAGLDPNSPRFAAANNACKHLLPNDGVAKGNVITPSDQADYLKAVACMRAHGFPDFPDPVFEKDNVAFPSRAAIDTNSAHYKGALAICEKLIPAGLPYSSGGS